MKLNILNEEVKSSIKLNKGLEKGKIPDFLNDFSSSDSGRSLDIKKLNKYYKQLILILGAPSLSAIPASNKVIGSKIMTAIEAYIKKTKEDSQVIKDTAKELQNAHNEIMRLQDLAGMVKYVGLHIENPSPALPKLLKPKAAPKKKGFWASIFD